MRRPLPNIPPPDDGEWALSLKRVLRSAAMDTATAAEARAAAAESAGPGALRRAHESAVKALLRAVAVVPRVPAIPKPDNLPRFWSLPIGMLATPATAGPEGRADHDRERDGLRWLSSPLRRLRDSLLLAPGAPTAR